MRNPQRSDEPAGFDFANPRLRLALVVVGAGLVLLFAVGGIGLGLYTILKKEDGKAEPVVVGPTRDVDEYTAELKGKVPIDAEGVKRSGYKADSYTLDENNPAFFVELVVRVEPVRLRDAVTGKTQVYTRARLSRDGSPPPGVMSLQEAQRRAQTAALNARWLRVEMLP